MNKENFEFESIKYKVNDDITAGVVSGMVITFDNTENARRFKQLILSSLAPSKINIAKYSNENLQHVRLTYNQVHLSEMILKSVITSGNERIFKMEYYNLQLIFHYSNFDGINFVPSGLKVIFN